MMFIRPIQRQDKQALLQLSTKTGSGFSSLPNNESHLEQRIERMIATWESKLPLSEQGYLFACRYTGSCIERTWHLSANEKAQFK
jgi:arginine N-succinyltransferase